MTSREDLIEAADALATVVKRLSADMYDHNYRARVIRAETLLRELSKSVFEQAHTPSDDEREALIDTLLETDLIAGYDWLGTGSSYPTNDEIRREVGEVADAALRFRRTVQGEPGAFDKRHADHDHVGPYCMPQGEQKGES